jgi:hypothetical protein
MTSIRCVVSFFRLATRNSILIKAWALTKLGFWVLFPEDLPLVSSYISWTILVSVKKALLVKIIFVEISTRKISEPHFIWNLNISSTIYTILMKCHSIKSIHYDVKVQIELLNHLLHPCPTYNISQKRGTHEFAYSHTDCLDQVFNIAVIVFNLSIKYFVCPWFRIIP